MLLKTPTAWVGWKWPLSRSVKIFLLYFSNLITLSENINHCTLSQNPFELLHKSPGFMQCWDQHWQNRNLWFEKIFMESGAPTTPLIYGTFKERHQLMLSVVTLLPLLMLVWKQDIRALHWHRDDTEQASLWQHFYTKYDTYKYLVTPAFSCNGNIKQHCKRYVVSLKHWIKHNYPCICYWDQILRGKGREQFSAQNYINNINWCSAEKRWLSNEILVFRMSRYLQFQ